MYRAQIQVLLSEKADVTNMVPPRNQKTLQIWTKGCKTIQMYGIVKKKQSTNIFTRFTQDKCINKITILSFIAPCGVYGRRGILGLLRAMKDQFMTCSFYSS